MGIICSTIMPKFHIFRPLEKARKQREMLLPSLSPIPFKNPFYFLEKFWYCSTIHGIILKV